MVDLRLNVMYYMRETVIVRLLHALQTEETEWKQVLVYAHVFKELTIQVKLTQRDNMPVREFFARFLLWREGKRFLTHGDTRTQSFHDICINETMLSLPTAHEACEKLYHGYLKSIDTKSKKQCEVSAEQELAKMMLIRLEMMKGNKKRMYGEVVRLIF